AGAGAVSPPWIAKGERSSLLMHIAATVNASNPCLKRGSSLIGSVLMSVEASRHRCKRLLAERKVVLPVLKMHDNNGAVFFHSFGIEAQASICFGSEVSRDNKPSRS